ncbi:hypothetical protein AHMF7605_25155 [Adhaeribacter arboris]|uniref:Peptidyl-prolyl cis-trans isomerase n=1 Tax=Adhaeribacter arboris TaxID=2072846 RepID=A0A2T2YM26_9BACT|nr:FKBP-type peptidyl-prolyl cis-trans isomerase [Adhaeribacter arboris]PSR56547.1 hypothetical protein AHMF7605_25155 [Adhaeribacter arboris]
MLKKSRFFVPVFAGFCLLQACNNNSVDFKKADNGVDYKLFAKDKSGKFEAKNAPSKNDTVGKPKEGQVLTMQMKYFTQTKAGKDTLLFDTHKNGFPVQIPIMKPTFKGGLEDAFSLVRAGDSAVFRISADSLFAKTFQQPMPPFIKKGSKLTFHVLAQKVQSQQEAMMDQQKMMMEFMEKQNKKDEQIIQEYVQKEGLKAQKTASGLYYVVNQPGSGAPAKAGQTVSVKYKGTLLDGKVFDSSDNPQLGGKPFQFTLGQQQVIRGWDEGIALLNKGAKCTLIVPSTMGYGPQAQGAIPANAVLRFDVELVDVK